MLGVSCQDITLRKLHSDLLWNLLYTVHCPHSLSLHCAQISSSLRSSALGPVLSVTSPAELMQTLRSPSCSDPLAGVSRCDFLHSRPGDCFRASFIHFVPPGHICAPTDFLIFCLLTVDEFFSKRNPWCSSCQQPVLLTWTHIQI